MSLFERVLERFLKAQPVPCQELQQLAEAHAHPLHWYLVMACVHRSILCTHALSEEHSRLLMAVPEQYSLTQLRQTLNYEVWGLEHCAIEFKDSSSFLGILREWVNVYEGFISRPEAEDSCFSHLLEFVTQNTRTSLERLVFVEEIFDDMKAVIHLQDFWETLEEVEITEPRTPIDNLDSLLGVLEVVTFRVEVGFPSAEETVWLYNPLLRAADGNRKYAEFVFRGLSYILMHRGILAKVEKNLTLTVLRFVAWTCNDAWAETLVARLLRKTSVAVRYALAKQYQETVGVLEHQGREDLLSALENIPELRELVKKKVESRVVEMQQYERSQLTVHRGEARCFFFEVTKPQSVLFLEYHVDVDIDVRLSFAGALRQDSPAVYLEERRSKSKSLQVLVNNCGLHCLTFDNTYSWLTAKSVLFSLNVFKPEDGDNDSFNLLVYPLEHTPWRGASYALSKDEEEEEFGRVWDSGICQRSDVVFRGGRVFFQGAIHAGSQFSLSEGQMKSIRSVLVVGPEQEWQAMLGRIVCANKAVKVRRCDEDDF